MGWMRAMVGAICILGMAGCGGSRSGEADLIRMTKTGAAASALTGAALTEARSGPRIDAEPARPALALALFRREHTYTLFAANGTRKTLRLSFEPPRYEILDGQHSTSGSFTEAVDEPGVYVFGTDRLASPFNPARFQLMAGGVIGGFPFEIPGASPPAYAVQPFVAANDFLAEPAALDSDYNRFAISRPSDGTVTPQATPLRISDGGTSLELCIAPLPTRMDLCPDVSRRRYAVASDGEGGWTAENAGTGDTLRFRVARLGTHNVWLAADADPAIPGARRFEIGLQDETAWPTGRFAGASTKRSWNTTTVTTTSIFYALNHRSTASNGSIGEFNVPVKNELSEMPAGMRHLDVAASGFIDHFLIQDGMLSATLGLRAAGADGALEIGLRRKVDGMDPRSGVYKVFAIGMQAYDLSMDFDAQTYAIVEPTGPAVDEGTFSADPAAPGTYVFQTARSTGVVNTARFRVLENALVGAFPFRINFSPTYAPQPFVAARSFVTSRRALAGDVYDTLYTGWGSLPPAVRIAVDPTGTLVHLCHLLPETTCAISQAPDAPLMLDLSARTGWYAGSPPRPGLSSFYVANIAGRRVLLGSAGTPMYGPTGAPTFGISMIAGVRRPAQGAAIALPMTVSLVLTQGGSFGSGVLASGRWTVSSMRSDGMPSEQSMTLQSISGNPGGYVGLSQDGSYLVLNDDMLVFAASQGGTGDGFQIGLR